MLESTYWFEAKQHKDAGYVPWSLIIVKYIKTERFEFKVNGFLGFKTELSLLNLPLDWIYCGARRAGI